MTPKLQRIFLRMLDRAVLFLAGMMHDDLVSISHWMRDFQPLGHEFELSDVHIRL